MTGDEPATTDEGNEERRRNRYVTAAEFGSWRNRATIAFLLLAIISSGSAFLAYRAGKTATNNLASAGRDATTKSCLSGVDLRIAVAGGLDDLRQLATRGAPKARVLPFLKQTQPSIDRILSQAAGRKYSAATAPTGAGELPGTVTLSVADEVRSYGVTRCQVRVESSFPQGDGTPTASPAEG